mmetsp:Transcript_3368/g.6149  ORF Transcript_3368/g.6149 Transcript_3368/m.6149 type:complete len:205 (-) Transcript_3368:893-1507(-)
MRDVLPFGTRCFSICVGTQCQSLLPLFVLLRFPQDAEVGVLEVLYLLDADICKQCDESAHLPALVHTERCEEKQRAIRPILHPKDQWEDDKKTARGDGEETMASVEWHIHLYGRQRFWTQRIGYPHLVFINDLRDTPVVFDGLFTWAAPWRVQRREFGRADKAPLSINEEEANDTDQRTYVEDCQVVSIHGLPLLEEYNVLTDQ